MNIVHKYVFFIFGFMEYNKSFDLFFALDLQIYSSTRNGSSCCFKKNVKCIVYLNIAPGILSVSHNLYTSFIMREAMLVTHFLGLILGLGSSFAFIFLGTAGSKMEKGEGRKFILNTFSLSRMGHIGLTLLVFSGLYLMTPFWKSLNSQPLLIAKLILVLVLLVSVSLQSVYSKRAKKGESDTNLKKIAALGKMVLLAGTGIVMLAVLMFR